MQVLLNVQAHHKEFMASLEWDPSPVNVRIGTNLHAHTDTGRKFSNYDQPFSFAPAVAVVPVSSSLDLCKLCQGYPELV
jgi:hypothetical protein